MNLSRYFTEFPREGEGAGGGGSGGGDPVVADAAHQINLDAIEGDAKQVFTDNKIATVGDLISFAGKTKASGEPSNLLEAALDPATFEGDKDIKAMLERKKYPNVSAALQGIVNMEKLLGEDNVIKAPIKGETTGFFKDNAEALGVPAEAKDYQLPDLKLPEGVTLDEAAVEKWKTFAHEKQIPQDLFNDFASAMVQDRLAVIEGRMAASGEAEEKTRAELRKEWRGPDFDRNMDLAKAAADSLAQAGVVDALGVDGDALDAKLGSVPLLKLFAWLGGQMDEGGIQLGEGVTFGAGASDAKVKIDQLKGDPDFRKRLTDKRAPGHKEAKKQWEDLHRQATGVT